MTERVHVPAREGRAFRVSPEQTLRILTPRGAQAADFFAYNAENTGEWLSPNHTWVSTRSVRPRRGDVLVSRFRRPMVEMTGDGAGGVHDMMLPACDKLRYEQLGFEGPHASCSDNLRTSMHRIGFQVDVIPQPINFFTNTAVESDGRFVSPPNPVAAGAWVDLKPLMALICVVSACPYDLRLADWTINAPGGPTEIEVEITTGDTRATIA